MARAGITKAGITKLVFGLAAAGLLAGCVDTQGGAGASGEAGFAAPAAKKKGAAQDVEAPDVFQTTDSALWDGRPSLGGIWVASSEVTNPERAVLFNPATGKSVTGALFKRERENPGPRLQLSSDAAEALGILAGQPTEIRVTALRKAETEKPEVAEATPAAATESQDAAAAPTDAAAIATAALDAVDAEKAGTASGAKAATADGSDGNAAAAATVAAGTAAVAAGAAEGGVAAVTETPKRKTWKERRAEAKAAREAKRRAAAEAKAAAAAGAVAAASPDGSEPAATPEAAAVADVATAPLDARKPEVAAGTAEKPKRRTVGDAPAAAAPADPGPSAASAAAPAPAGGPVRPIQVASFSKEDNARRAAEALAKIGVTATPQKSEKAGKAVWGVVVQGDEAMLKKIKDAGFADAYFLK